MMRSRWLPLVALLTSCAAPISGNPVQDVAAAVTPKIGITDLQDTAYNLDQAVTVGALDTNDPAPPCLHSALQELGVEGTPAPSFTPKIGGIASLASVAYIRAQQLKKLQGGPQLPANCEALIGRLFMDGLKSQLKALPGAGLLP